MVSQELLEILRCPNCVREKDGMLKLYARLERRWQEQAGERRSCLRLARFSTSLVSIRIPGARPRPSRGRRGASLAPPTAPPPPLPSRLPLTGTQCGGYARSVPHAPSAAA